MTREEALFRIIDSNLDVAEFNKNPLRLERYKSPTSEVFSGKHESLLDESWYVMEPRRGSACVKCKRKSREQAREFVTWMTVEQGYSVVSHPLQVMFTEKSSGRIVYKNKDGELARGNKECYFVVGTLDVAMLNNVFYSEFLPTYLHYPEVPNQDKLEVLLTLGSSAEFGITIKEYETKGK
jgi:hypothetical protein